MPKEAKNYPELIMFKTSTADKAWLKEYCRRNGCDMSSVMREQIEKLRSGVEANPEIALIKESHNRIYAMHNDQGDLIADLANAVIENNEILDAILAVLMPSEKRKRPRQSAEEILRREGIIGTEQPAHQ